MKLENIMKFQCIEMVNEIDSVTQIFKTPNVNKNLNFHMLVYPYSQ